MENSLFFEIGADLTPFNRGIEGAVDRVVGLGKVAVGVGLAAVATAIGKTGLDALKASSQMEAYEIRLGTMMGSAEDARARLDELFAFAAATPFNTEQIVAAEVTLRGFGAAAEDVMPGLIDFAATTGADLSQSAIDIGKAWSQGATGLESDTAKILRKQVEMRLGTDATKVSLEEFRAAMLETLDEGMFAGGAARLSRTFTGLVSNLQDAWDGFLRDVGKGSDLFDNVKGAAALLLDEIEANRDAVHELAVTFGNDLWKGIRTVSLAGAAFVDAIRAGYGAAELVRGGIDAVNAAILQAESSAFGLAGALGSATAAAMSRNLADQAAAARERAAAEMEVAQTIAGDTNPAYRAMLDLLGRAEGMTFDLTTTAKGTAQAMREVGEEGSKAGKDIEKGMLDAINAWVAYYEETQRLRLGDLGKQDQWLADSLAKAKKLTQDMGGDYADFLMIKENLDEEYRRRLQEANDDFEARARDEAQRTLEQKQEFERRYAEQSLSSLSSLLGDIAGMMDDSNAEQKAAAKELAYAQIAINTAVAVMQAAASAPWPYNLIPIGFAVAEGVAQGIAVSQAHQGYTPAVQASGSPSPDEVSIRALRTESLLSSQTTRRLGPDGIRALEMGGPGGAVQVNLHVGRVTQREIVRTDLRTNGPMSREYRRAARNGDIATGMSGQRAA